MSLSIKLPGRMSLREFLNWEPTDGQRYELVDGLPRAMAPAGAIHGRLQARLARLIDTHLESSRPACSAVVDAGVIPHLLSARNVRIPDLAVTCSPLLPGQATLADPVLLIEIVSPSNHAETWSNVWAYTSIPSVQEILVLYADRVAAERLRRGFDGAWPEQPDQIAERSIELTSIGFVIPLDVLYARTGLTS